MASRVGLDRGTVVAAAVRVVDREGVRALSLARLSQELSVRAPSLYTHVDGQRGLHRELWLFCVTDFGETLRSSVMGRSGEDALFAFATAYRAYATAHPGRYQITLSRPEPFDEEAVRAYRRANEPYKAVIRSFGLDREQALHAGRAFRSALHGFVTLEAESSLGRGDVDESFGQLVALLAKALRPAGISAVSAVG